jgi:hypothetical protein
MYLTTAGPSSTGPATTPFAVLLVAVAAVCVGPQAVAGLGPVAAAASTAAAAAAATAGVAHGCSSMRSASICTPLAAACKAHREGAGRGRRGRICTCPAWTAPRLPQPAGGAVHTLGQHSQQVATNRLTFTHTAHESYDTRQTTYNNASPPVPAPRTGGPSRRTVQRQSSPPAGARTRTPPAATPANGELCVCVCVCAQVRVCMHVDTSAQQGGDGDDEREHGAEGQPLDTPCPARCSTRCF